MSIPDDFAVRSLSVGIAMSAAAVVSAVVETVDFAEPVELAGFVVVFELVAVAESEAPADSVVVAETAIVLAGSAQKCAAISPHYDLTWRKVHLLVGSYHLAASLKHFVKH